MTDGDPQAVLLVEEGLTVRTARAPCKPLHWEDKLQGYVPRTTLIAMQMSAWESSPPRKIYCCSTQHMQRGLISLS